MLTTEPVPLPPDAVDALAQHVAAGERAASRPSWRRGRGSHEAQARGAAAQELLDRGTTVAVHVEHDSLPALLRHEHGLIILIPVTDHQTHLLDISSVADDPRWELFRTGKLMRRTWRWVRLGDLGFHRFRAEGDPVQPVDLGEFHGTALETILTEGDAGWPGDDATLAHPFAHLVELAGRTG